MEKDSYKRAGEISEMVAELDKSIKTQSNRGNVTIDYRLYDKFDKKIAEFLKELKADLEKEFAEL